jgi:hypothetical protein
MLVELQQDLARAWLAGDRPMRERIIAPESTRIHGLKIDEVRARVFGNAAVVTGRTRGVGEFDALVMTL